MRELFIYYRVPSALVRSVQEQVETFQARLRSELPNLLARLLRRPGEDAAGQTTFMETYAVEPAQGAGVDAAMQSRIEAAARHIEGLASARHVEVFVACRPE